MAVDEWHELLGTKRGVQVELAISRIARYSGITERSKWLNCLGYFGNHRKPGTGQEVLISPSCKE